jgi:hypothetical protein
MQAKLRLVYFVPAVTTAEDERTQGAADATDKLALAVSWAEHEAAVLRVRCWLFLDDCGAMN